MKMQSIYQTRGFGIVDILIGFIILCILLSGFASVMINHSKGFEVGNNLQQIQRRGTSGLFYFSSFSNPDFRIFSSYFKQDVFQSNLELVPSNAKIVAGATTNINNSDTITVIYPFDHSNMFNCLAVNASVGQKVETILFVTANHELACAQLKNNLPALNHVDVLVDGVDAMRIRYGEDLNNNGAPDRYVAADFPGLLMSRVVSIKISLLLRTPEKANMILDPKYYTLQDIELGPFNDNYFRKVYTSMIPISGLASGQAEY